MERESMEYDVVVVGAGPSGLAAAIRLMQLAAEQGRELSACVVEKGAEVGAHILSGAVMDPRGMDDLIPGWRDKGCPIEADVTEDAVWYMTEGGSWTFPITPRPFRNHGKVIVSLGDVVRWLGEQAEALEIEANRLVIDVALMPA